MSLIARLKTLAAAAFGGPQASAVGVGVDDNGHVAATALLVYVARADGILDPAESERLVRLVRNRYAGTDAEAQALIARAGTFESQTRDMASLVELIDREDAEERAGLLAMAWSVAGADGEVHEFEEALVWRLGALLGLDEAAIAGARSRATPAPDGATAILG